MISFLLLYIESIIRKRMQVIEIITAELLLLYFFWQ